MSDTAAAPIFTVTTADGRKGCGLFGLLAAAARGDVVDLPDMAAHQRAPVVTVLAIVMHVLARYADVDRLSESSWARAWDELIGPDALRVTAPHNEVAFLQPPTNEPTSRQSIEAADLFLPNVEHEIKRTWSTARADTAIFSLIGSLSRPNVKDHRSSTRTGLCAVLPSADGTVGSEICSLVSAYDRLNLPTGRSTRAADHFVWLRPYRPKADEPISFADLARRFLDIARAQRVVKTEDNRFEIWACPNNTSRVTGTDPWLDDPHTPRETDADRTKRYKLAAKVFDHRFQHHVLFGVVDKRNTIDRPRILDLVDYRCVRLCALGTDQGKTRGYHEALFVAARSNGLFHLEPPNPEDRASRLSASALATIEAGSKVLYSALAALYPDTDDLNDTERSRIRRAQFTYYHAVGCASVQLVFDLLNLPENASEEQQRFDALIAAQVRQAFHLAATALLRPLHTARAERRLETGIHFTLKGESMSKEVKVPGLARRAFAILREAAEHATPNDRARLRTMFLPEPPLSFWKMMAAVPQEQVDNEHCLTIWKIVLRALGNVRHSSGSLGRALAVLALISQKLNEEEAKAWSDAVMGLWRKEGAKVDSDTPLVVGEKEIGALADACVALAAVKVKPEGLYKLIDSARELGKASPKAQEAIESMRAVRSNAGIDGALFGRFATGIAVNNVDSAVHVAHLVTVHPLFSVTDFFSVQDLLKTGEGEDRGGSHINTAELTSGLFYGYVVVDVGQLNMNFAELTNEQRAAIAGWLVRGVAQVEPAAKLGSTAPYSGLRELMVEVGRRQPRSLMGAFERPVEATQNRTLSEEARRRLEAHATEMDSLMGAPEYRSTLRRHVQGPLPAVEALSDEVAGKLATLAA